MLTYFFLYYFFKWELSIALHKLKAITVKTVTDSFVRKGEGQKKKKKILQITTNFFKGKCQMPKGLMT